MISARGEDLKRKQTASLALAKGAALVDEYRVTQVTVCSQELISEGAVYG
jgi:hypothetical protein